MIRTVPFTSFEGEFRGTLPYAFHQNPNPSTANAPAVRSASLPPITAPGPTPTTRYKTGASPAINPSWWVRGGANPALGR